MEYCLAQVLQKDVGKRLQVGQELIDYFSDKHKSTDLEHDQTMLDKMVDGLATSWVNSSNYKVRLVFSDGITNSMLLWDRCHSSFYSLAKPVDNHISNDYNKEQVCSSVLLNYIYNRTVQS